MIAAGSHIIDPSIIWVDREKRQRRELVGIPELAASIAKFGLIHPPVVTRDHEIIAGERRWTAVRSLGWTAIEVRYVDEVPASELHMIELEENIRRVDISWQEQCLALQRWHELKKSEDPAWAQENTSEELNISQSEISHRLALAEEILAGNESVASVDKISSAKNILKRQTERKKQSALAALDDGPVNTSVPLRHEDFHEWAAGYTGVKFNFIHCDFPYGIAADNQQQGNNIALHGGYADGLDVYERLLASLSMAMSNVVADHAHLMFWFSLDYYEMTRNALTEMGWRVNPFPLIWHKSDNTGLLPDPQRGPRRVYETAFLASRGDRLIVNSVSNLFAHPGKDKEIHMSEKPVEMLQHFFRMFVDSNSVVLDPTAGSGNALWAAKEMGANYVLGLERDPAFHERSVAAWKARSTEAGA